MTHLSNFETHLVPPPAAQERKLGQRQTPRLHAHQQQQQQLHDVYPATQQSGDQTLPRLNEALGREQEH